MQIRMNISALEDWALQNNRKPEHYEQGSTISSGESAVDAARRYLEPVHQLLQWLQVMSGIGDDFEALIGTRQQLPRLNPQQLIHSAKYYRAEVGEGVLPKSAMKYLVSLRDEVVKRRGEEKKARLSQNQKPNLDDGPSTPVKFGVSTSNTTSPQQHDGEDNSQIFEDDEDQAPDPDNLFLDPAHTLPFSLPSSTDMLVSYGAGFGGKNRERERKYIPSVPPEFLEKLNFGNGGGKTFEDEDEDNE